MSDPDADLKAMFAATFKGAQPTDDCPTPEHLYEAFHKLLPMEETLSVLDHIATCAVCADSWRLASRTDAPAPERR